MRVTPDTILNAADMTSNQSATQQLDQIFGYSVQAVYTGSPTGTLKLQASNDNTSYVDIADSSNSITGAGETMWNVTSANYAYVKVVYTASSGSGSLTVKFFGRGF